MKRDGTFSIQVLGDRDIVIHPTDTTSYERLCEDEALNDLALVTKVEQTELLLATMGIKNNQSKEATPKSTRKAAKGNGSTSVRSTVSKKAKRSESTTPLVSSKTKESMTSSMQSQYEEGITSTAMLENSRENSPVDMASAAMAVMRKSSDNRPSELMKREDMRVSDYDNLEEDNISGIV